VGLFAIRPGKPQAKEGARVPAAAPLTSTLVALPEQAVAGARERRAPGPEPTDSAVADRLAPQIAAPEGFTLARAARLEALEGTQFTWVGPAGGDLSLFVTKASGTTETALVRGTLKGLETFQWSTPRGNCFMVARRVPERDVLHAAVSARLALEPASVIGETANTLEGREADSTTELKPAR
jgi:hypothetical protein